MTHEPPSVSHTARVRNEVDALDAGRPPSRALGVLAGVAVVLIWSGWITLSRHGAAGGLTIYDMTALRFGTAALVTSPLWRKFPWRRVRVGAALVVALGCGFPYVLLTFFGLRTMGAASAGVVVNGSLPIASAWLGLACLKRRPRRAVWITAIAVLAANGCMISGGLPALISDGAAAALGLACLLAAAFVLATYMTAVQAWGFAIPEVLVLVPFINAILFVPVWWLALPSSLATATLSQVAIQAAYQGVVVSVIALVLFTECVKRLGAIASSLFMAFVPACTAALAWWLLGEALSPWQLGGIALCSAALLYYAASANPRRGRGASRQGG
jgi:drug/metabolite transporter (DMT)-like permease